MAMTTPGATEQNLPEQKTCSRRLFLKAGGVSTGLAVVPGALAASAATDASKGKRLAMVIDLQRCTGCGGCILTCKNENNVQLGVAWSNKISRTVGTFPNVRYDYIPTLCNHCANAPCVKSCPTGAMHKGHGDITKHTPKKCVGCKTCKAVCPYDVIHPNAVEPHRFWRDKRALMAGGTSSGQEVAAQVNSDVIPYYNPAKEDMGKGAGLRYKGIAEKCTFCDHRTTKGELPYCVEGCPANARIFGDLNDPNSDVSKLLSRYRSWRLKEELGTEPKVFYIRDFNAGANKAKKGSA